MRAPFARRTAAEIMNATFLARWADRAALSPGARTTLGEILDRFVAEGAPIEIATLRHSGAVDELLPGLLRAP